jgi:hypothetical protein
LTRLRSTNNGAKEDCKDDPEAKSTEPNTVCFDIDEGCRVWTRSDRLGSNDSYNDVANEDALSHDNWEEFRRAVRSEGICILKTAIENLPPPDLIFCVVKWTSSSKGQ